MAPVLLKLIVCWDPEMINSSDLYLEGAISILKILVRDSPTIVEEFYDLKLFQKFREYLTDISLEEDVINSLDLLSYLYMYSKNNNIAGFFEESFLLTEVYKLIDFKGFEECEDPKISVAIQEQALKLIEMVIPEVSHKFLK